MGTFTKPASEFVDTDLVQEHLSAAARHVGERAAEQAMGLFRAKYETCLRTLDALEFDSPLEVLFWIWWNAWINPDGKNSTMEECACTLWLQPHVNVVLPDGQHYCLDFEVQCLNEAVLEAGVWTPIGVELDGHAFHERTPEQVAYRDRRDRDLQAAGWKIFHFSFSEFTSRPADCTGEVIIFSYERFNDMAVRENARLQALLCDQNSTGLPPYDDESSSEAI